MTDTIFDAAKAMMAEAGSWHDLRRRLDAAGLSPRLGAAGLDRLLGEWHRHAAAALSDRDLGAELRFWAEGGHYTTHLHGYQAVPPPVLAQEARARGWLVQSMASGGVLVSLPGERPLLIRTLGHAGLC